MLLTSLVAPQRFNQVGSKCRIEKGKKGQKLLFVLCFDKLPQAPRPLSC